MSRLGELGTERQGWSSVIAVEWVGWFNHRRLCGDMPPAEMEAAHCAQQRGQAITTSAVSASAFLEGD